MAFLKKHTGAVYLLLAVLFLFAGFFVLNYRFNIIGSLILRFDKNSTRVPILMYHHFADDGSPGTTISGETFESHMKALHDGDYNTITFEELRAYVYDGASLPERPVIITIDDGYTSVYDIAFPILKKYDLKATVFIIGILHGETLYKDTQYPIYPEHFGDAEALEMIGSGLISIQSHSYDMHQMEGYETGPFRQGVLRREDESEEDYIAAFNADFKRASNQIANITGERPFVFSYPFGRHSDMSEELLRKNGVIATVTIVEGKSIVKRYSPECLFGLKRQNVYGNYSVEKLLAMVRQ